MHNNTHQAEQVRHDVQQSQRPSVKLSRDPNKAMQEMMGTIDLLRNAMIEETKALKDTDTQTFMALQDNKLEVARDYLEGMAQLMNRKDELKNADPKLKDRLEKMRNEFAETAYDNHAALNRMKNGMKRLGDRIMEAARETAKKEKQFIYGATGRLQSATGGTIGVSESA